MLFWEYSCKNVGVVGYAEAFTTILSGKQASETWGYLKWMTLGQRLGCSLFMLLPQPPVHRRPEKTVEHRSQGDEDHHSYYSHKVSANGHTGQHPDGKQSHSFSATGFQFSAYWSHFAQRCSTDSGDWRSVECAWVPATIFLSFSGFSSIGQGRNIFSLKGCHRIPLLWWIQN